MTHAAMAYLLVLKDEASIQERVCTMLCREQGERSDHSQKGIAVLRGLPQHPQAIVVILTGYRSDEMEKFTLTLGIDPIVTRQCLLHDLASAVDAMMGGSRRQEHFWH